MSKIIEKTVVSKYAPHYTNVDWLDVSGDKPVKKSYINGKWVVVGGGGGGTKKYSDLEDKPLINGVELNGNKTSQDLGVYSKPSSGIPQSDLAQSVQTSLNKADTAYQKPLSGIPESDLSSDVQQALQKHFKGWYTSSSELPANPVVGDYAYVKGGTTSDPATIYECTTVGSWSDSGRTVDTSNVQTFASGEEVNEVHIVNDLTTGGVDDVLSAEQGKILNQQSIYDVSVHNPTAGPNSDGKFASLSALLSDSNINTLIPTAVRCGGMSIKYVQSSDNKYVQYFLTKNTWSVSEGDWQKMNLEEEVSQLGQEVDELDVKVSGGNVYTQIATDSFLSSITVGTTQFNVINGQTYKVHCQSSESLNQNNLAVYFKRATDDTRLSGTYNSGNSVDFAEGVDFNLVATATGNAVLRISTNGVTSHKTLSFVIYKVDETEGLIQKVGELETFDASIPLSDIQYITKNVFCLKDYYIDNSYYDASIGKFYENTPTYGCTQKLPVDCVYLFNFGFKPSSVFFWDSEDNYLGSVSPAIGGKTDFPDNTAFVAYNMIKASQSDGYVDSGILYNLEPFVPYSSLNTRIYALENFKNDVPLDETKQLTKRIFCVKNFFIDNSYYGNNNGTLYTNTPTYACTGKIPVDKAYYFIDGFKQTTCLCWDDSTFLGTCRYNNEDEKRFDLLEGTTFIAFNLQKSVQPEDYINNGIIFNLSPFVLDYNEQIAAVNAQNILFGKKWCVVGDSFSAWTTEQDGTVYKTYHYFIKKRNNMTIENMAVSGRTMTYPNDHTFDNAFAKPSVYQSIPADSDYITIMLGINDVSHLAGYSPDGESTAGAISIGDIDSSDTGTFYGAWNTVMQWIFENRPTAHVGIIITNGLGAQGPNGGYSEYGMQIYTALKNIVKRWNVPFIDLNGGDGKTPMMQRGIYPEGTPAALIAAKWNAFAASPTGTLNGHTNVAGHLYESYCIEDFLRSL